MTADFYTNLGLILILIFINGIFSMSEISIVSSTKAKLQKLIAENRIGAQSALRLHEEPTRFLSTVQVGITAIGILSGALGEEFLHDPLHDRLSQITPVQPYAETLSLVLTVLLITYFSVVLGELVPKRLALQNPERIASAIAKPMRMLADVFSPLVWLLSLSSHLLLRLLRLHQPRETEISDEEIKILMDMGSESGVFHAGESQWVHNIMKLDEMKVAAIMVPRQDIDFIDILDSADNISSKIANSPFGQIVVCRGGLDDILGILHCGDQLKTMLRHPNKAFNIEKELRPPIFIQDSLTVNHLLLHFRENQFDFALVVNEYGDIEGLVTLMDILAVIVGDLLESSLESGFDTAQRPDGSWLVDGRLPVVQMKSLIGISGKFPGESGNHYHTLAGMIVHNLERLPKLADYYETEEWRFEIVDMDGSRIDKVLITPISKSA